MFQPRPPGSLNRDPYSDTTGAARTSPYPDLHTDPDHEEPARGPDAERHRQVGGLNPRKRVYRGSR